MESRLHRQIAKKLANIKRAEYSSDLGVDIKTPTQAIEVEVDPSLFGQAKRQLAGTTKTPYLAVPTRLLKKAKVEMGGTRFGVMSPSGRIVKRGVRK